jgi:hypothetical protein
MMVGRSEALMRVDLYTKILLTTIAVCLLTLAFKSMVEPKAALAAGTDFVVLCASCSYGHKEGQLVLMDRSNGDIWMYSDLSMFGIENPVKFGQLTLGKRITKY